MGRFFDVNIEFNRDKVNEIIFSAISNKQKGYVCSIESNNLSIANVNPEYNTIINGSLVNICDGSVLAKILAWIHQQDFDSYIGADLFLAFIEMKTFKQYFLGNTQEILDSLRVNLAKIDPAIQTMRFCPLPFVDVERFDYPAIAKDINADQPDIIWVSLGAPKQEIFMHKLLPYLEQGVMFGFGAVFNFNADTGSVKRAPKWMLRWRLEWLYRAYEEPRKTIPRYIRFLCLLPRLVWQEYQTLRQQRRLIP
ncbi:WecB/TagA/CpsF family glycosyltransferase [Thermostichus vulcanus]|uniref:WecB/TagA/CpsF family glycosyltransferase n=1 Tax=Thermostichus vulcanus str. 'Rupite' TaxID=2813851 RepID=A0ABT0CCE6_THEVL|nr:WecB/TagA/CpsF family glycosyltransferase [Thermostichus vulcanus]MCJ2543433.1 WecB/TagA/CpsF family glycosyltransferase [Thermostichus vulcanus str. 'Rupite']